MAACPRCGLAAAEGARFCFACGSPLAGPAVVDVHARKTVTVVFADVSGFTALGDRLDPEALQLVMTRYFAEMRGVIERHGGTVEKFIGDAVMAVFGVPVLHEDDVVRAARAALEMRTALDALNGDLAESWDVRLVTHTGVNTGEIAVSTTPEGEPFTLGDPVNVAQRLESAAGPGEILIGPITERLLRGSARVERIEPMRLKGKADLVAAWRLVALNPMRPVGARSSLVGRTAELGAMRDAFVEVIATRTPAMVTLTGPAGIGKSRLARELRNAISPRAAVAVGRCVPYGEGVTYRPLAEIVRGLSERVDEDAISGLTGDDAEGRRVAARIARLVGASPGPVAVEEAHWAVRRLFEVAARDRPLVVFVDDIHWAEPTLLDALEHVAAHASGVPLLVVCLARPELFERRPEWMDEAERRSVVTLGPLDDAAAATLLAELAADGRVATVDRRRLLATAEGNPFFLEQMVAMLDEPAGLSGGLPPTIQALLAARIDALPSPERAVLDRAAIEGGTFHTGAIARLLPADAATGLEERLAWLTRRQLIRPAQSELRDEEAHRFAHILIRDVAYSLVSKAARADLHEGYAAWFDERGDEARDEVVGYHLEQAHRIHEELHPAARERRRPLATSASRRLGTAGRAALDRGDLPAGVNLLERATALLAPDDPHRARTTADLGMALVQLGRLADATAVLDEAATRAAERGDALAEAHATTARFFACVQVDSAAAAEDLSADFDARARTFAVSGDEVGLDRLWRARGFVHWLAGRSAEAAADWMRGAGHAAAADDDHGRADALSWVICALALGPTPVWEAIERCDAMLAELAFERHVAALSMRPIAHLHAMAGSFDVARDLLERSNVMLGELGVSMHSAVTHYDALVALLAGDAGRAEAVLRTGYEQLDAMGERSLLATSAGLLARALVEQDRSEEAWAYLDVAEEAAAPDDLSAHMVARTERARLLARRGAMAEADRLSAEAVALAAQTDWVIDRAGTLVARAEVLRAAGDSAAAVTTIREGLALYVRKGDVVSARRARALLNGAG
jgi:class 3 adenylate cyclase/tetratricopeptide (TPR) repeat protein